MFLEVLLEGPLGGSAPFSRWVNNHADRKSTIPGVLPLRNGLFMAYKIR